MKCDALANPSQVQNDELPTKVSYYGRADGLRMVCAGGDSAGRAEDDIRRADLQSSADQSGVCFLEGHGRAICLEERGDHCACTSIDAQAESILSDPHSIDTAFAFAINTIIDASPLSASDAREIVRDLDQRVAAAAQRTLNEWPSMSHEQRSLLCGTAQQFALTFAQHRVEIESQMRANHWG